MAKKRRGTNAYRPEAYSHASVHEEREYGFFWYEWLWKMLRPVMVFMCSLLIIIGIASTVWKKIDESLFMPVDPASTETVEFVIESGETITGIGKKLVDQKLLRNASVFKYIVQFQGLTNAISYGSYEISPAMNVNEIITELSSGNQTNERTITIIPGWTVEDVADYLVDEEAIANRDEFLSLCNQPEKFVKYSYSLSAAYNAGALEGRKYALEGYLAPDTYRVFRSADAESIIKTHLSQGNTVIDNVFYSDHSQYSVDAEGVYTEVEQYHSELSMDEIIILASMIEKEAGLVTDYSKVSAVFYNRLALGWKLESDATVNYVTGKSALVINGDELAVDSPFNTYANAGLPAGPICNPSQQAMLAALYPDTLYISEGYMCFCAEEPESGSLAFAVTKEDHEANVARYRPLWEAFDQLHND